MTDGVDITWMLVCIALVMFMQAGFLCLETGLTRSKNNINVAVKNLTDLGVSIVLFWLVGFSLMFGASSWGFMGTDRFALELSSVDPQLAAFFLFQALFCGAAVTIMSGAAAGRLRFGWYVVLAAAISAFIYPMLGHWIWNEQGWLAQFGFVDFAGTSVVHSVGGWAGLATILVLGPRRGRFDGATSGGLPGADTPLATLGALFFWIGWVGFNGGSLFEFDGRVVGVVVNTALAGAAGLVTALGIGWLRFGLPRVTDSINGILAGLVAVTGVANAVGTRAAVVIGVVGAIWMLAVEWLLERRRIDDAVGAVPVHLGAGVWGTLAVALFGDRQLLGFGNRLEQLLVQGLGVAVTGAWVFGTVWLLCRIGNRVSPLRVSAHDEDLGLNVSEHGASTELLDLFRAMNAQASTADLSARVPESPFTEAGQLGAQYNRVIAALEVSLDELDTSQRVANLDVLTQTLNRRGLIATLDAFAGRSITVVMFDLVDFGVINTNIGYSAADDVLCQVVTEVGSRLGSDWWFGRWGGDEFLAVSPDPPEISGVLFDDVECELPSGASMSVQLRGSIVTSAPDTPRDDLVRRASYALDRAKRESNRIVSFDAELERDYVWSIELAEMIDELHSGSRIVPVAQTIVSGGRVVGAELLARWRNDDGSLAGPAEFLPVLLETGMLGELDLYMAKQAVDFAARFNNRPQAPWISVNASAPTLAIPTYVETIAAALNESGVDPRRLLVEVTESEEILTPDYWLQGAQELRRLGVGLAVDDFGSGYSGIQRMSDLPITHIKFDRNLVRSVSGPLGGVVRSVVEYARDVGVIPVAEGVETLDQQVAIQTVGVDLMQGFLFSRPEMLDDVEREVIGQASSALTPTDFEQFND